MTGEDIIKKALKYKNYVYWYGGKGQKCTTVLLNTLKSLYPSTYTTNYVNKCKKDISAGKYCIDCSGLVCRAYGIKDIGTYQMATDKRFKEWEGTPLNGMIVWKWGHVGLYYNGKVVEARGIDYDVTTNRTYKKSDWNRIFYFDGVDYGMTAKTSKTAVEYLNAAIDVINGKYGTGTTRKTALKKAGFDADKVQNIVNLALK